MRCIVCDYCDTQGSHYYVSLIDPKGSKKRYVFLDKKTNTEICNWCYDGEKKS